MIKKATALIRFENKRDILETVSLEHNLSFGLEEMGKWLKEKYPDAIEIKLSPLKTRQ